MRNILTSLIIAVSVSGCATVANWIPSFWDDNQSAYIVQLQLTVDQLDCAQAQTPQVLKLHQDLRRFELYSEAKGSLQRDVLRVTEPISTTTKEWRDRGEGSKTYCEIKKKLLTQQSARAARVILGRY